MSIRKNFKHTLFASYAGYFVQAIINNFAPLLFLTFQSDFKLSYEQISLLIFINFFVQLMVDMLSTFFVDRIGYRRCIVTAHFLAAAGLILLGILPYAFSNAFLCIIISIVIYAFGSGLIEVIISPLVEACPTENKSGSMSLLHSFYCWGQMCVILFSTLFFAAFGIKNWRLLSALWALIPILNGFYLSVVPFPKMLENSQGMSIKGLFKNRFFVVCCVIMFCAGSCELSICQWGSAFAESALGVTKPVGDLLGPCAFAALMGTARVLYARFSTKIQIKPSMLFSAVLCVIGYLITSLSPIPLLSLVGFAVCGFSVGIMWPGTFSLCAKEVPTGGTAMFALLALFGDLGCASGPYAVGIVTSFFGDDLSKGLLFATAFPLLLIVMLLSLKKNKS